jgi:hypothetical protein
VNKRTKTKIEYNDKKKNKRKKRKLPHQRWIYQLA